MDGRACLTVGLSLWGFLLLSGVEAADRRPAERNAEIPGVSMSLGALTITSERVTLRCDIRNDSEDDVWICAECPEGRGVAATSKGVVCVDADARTLIVLHRMNRPTYGETFYFVPSSATYRRLPAGQRRAEELSVQLPVQGDTNTLGNGFVQATDKGIHVAERLAFEIGCYTTGTLESLAQFSRSRPRVRFEDSGDEAVVLDYPGRGAWMLERAVRLVVEGVDIPYKTWLGVGIPRPREPEQLLEDMFYRFSLSLKEYRFAQRLSAIDESLLDAKTQRMRDLYVQFTEDTLSRAELAPRLKEVAVEAEREGLLQRLERAQAAAEEEQQSRIAGLLARAQRLDSTAEGLEALGLLREILAIDPSNDEAFDLMEKTSAYYKGKTMTNSIDMELVWIPGGEFVMGKEGDARQPRHTVKITGGFWMGVREVTCGQYQVITGENTRAPDDDAAPARNVSWHDARTFCRRLSEKEGRNYRLPTEAEWEYACRAGTSTDYWWGDDPEADPCTPNPFGLLHMNDGVAEWCEDVVSVGYYIASPELDPQGPSGQYRKNRIFRGGRRSAQFAGKGTCYYRDGEDPKQEYDNLGFRVVLESSSALDQQSLVSTGEPADCQGL